MGRQLAIWQRINDFLVTVAQGTSEVASSIGSALDPDNWLPGGRDAAFTLALVALSAKMAVADGVVTRTEVQAFRANVIIPPGSEAQVNRLFELAQQDVAGYQSYARKIARLFAEQPETLEHVLDALFHIASADGFIHQDELEYLKNVSDIFGFDEMRFEQIVATHLVDTRGADPYLVLGLMPNAPWDEVRRVYLRLVAEHHPDRLAAKGVPPEMMALTTARMAAINGAYAAISRNGKVQGSEG